MRNRLRGSLLRAALTPLALTFTHPALAQNPTADAQQEQPTEEPTSDLEGADSLDPAPSEEAPQPADPPALPASPPEPAPEPVQPAPATAAAAPASSPVPKDTSSEPVAEAAGGGTEVILEVAPASAYPAPRTRGIVGGSLAATMHGLQWPYLPAVKDQNTLRVAVSGYLWNDLSYARILSGLEESQPNQKRFATQTRGVLRFSPTISTKQGWFAQGQGELVGLGDQILETNNSIGSTDDFYVRAGKWNLFDITVGRFQGWEIANHYGMGLDLNTLEREGAVIQDQAAKPQPSYGLTYFWDRKNSRVGHYAAHLYPTDYLRFELLAELGAGTAVGRTVAYRPSGIFDVGFLKVKAGFEYGTELPQEDDVETRIYRNGFGVAVQGVFAPWIEGGVSFARGYEDRITAQGVKNVSGSNTVTGYGAFLNVRPVDSLVIGVGLLDSHWENLFKNAAPGPNFGDHDTNDQVQTFLAVQYSFWDQFSMKLVGSHAKFDFYESSSTPFSNEMWGVRYRMAVAF